jgi:hypothetical protein
MLNRKKTDMGENAELEIGSTGAVRADVHSGRGERGGGERLVRCGSQSMAKSEMSRGFAQSNGAHLSCRCEKRTVEK